MAGPLARNDHAIHEEALHASKGLRYAAALADDLTLDDTYPNLLELDPGGAGRTITLPAEATSEGVTYLIRNTADADEDLTVTDDTPTTVDVVEKGAFVAFYCDGSSWTATPIYQPSNAVFADVALSAAGSAVDVDTSIDHATADAQGVSAIVTQGSTVRTGGVVAGVEAGVVSTADDTGGTFACLRLQSTDGGGSTPVHAGIYCDDALDAFLIASATGKGGATVGAMTAKSPESDTEAGFLTIRVGATPYEIPFYAVA